MWSRSRNKRLYGKRAVTAYGVRGDGRGEERDIGSLLVFNDTVLLHTCVHVCIV